MSKKLFRFDDDRELELIECIGKGATCTSYKCNVYIKNQKPIVGIVKEFLPMGLTELNSFDTDFVHPLPEDREKFIKSYERFIETINQMNEIFNELSSSDNSFKMYYDSPDINSEAINRKFELNEAEGTYRAIMLLPYYGEDFGQCVQDFSLRERLVLLSKLCGLVDKFHENNIVLCDLKPSNFIYQKGEITSVLKLFDFDSIVRLDDDGRVNRDYRIYGIGSPFFGAPEATRTQYGENQPCDIGKHSDLYSVGAMLLYFVLYDIFLEVFEINDLCELQPEHMSYLYLDCLPSVLGDDTFKRLHDKNGSIKRGFWQKFKSIVEKAMATTINSRCTQMDSDKSLMLNLKEQIDTLIEIYDHKGVHPEIMLDNITREFEKADRCDKNQINDRLLCKVREC